MRVCRTVVVVVAAVVTVVVVTGAAIVATGIDTVRISIVIGGNGCRGLESSSSLITRSPCRTESLGQFGGRCGAASRVVGTHYI